MSCAIAFLVYPPSGADGPAEAAQIRSDHGVLVGKFCDQRPPHMAGFGKAMQQHDGITLAGNQIVQLDAVGFGEFALRRRFFLK